MNFAAFALRKQTLMVVLTIMVAGMGLISFEKLGRLEDPTFTIKTALIITPYPGASPLEVEEEVTQTIEEAIKAMGQVKEIYSTSKEGLSFVYVDMKDTYTAPELPQIWDELRRKINDVQSALPPGAGPSIVRDDFGDVYGAFFAISGDGCSQAQLRDYAQFLKKELLLCKDVAKIDFWGIQKEAVYIEFERARMAELGISRDLIYRTLHLQNVVQQSGHVDVDTEYMRITPTGEFKDESAIADLLVGGPTGLIRLGDIATIYRDYMDPPRNLMRFNGKPAIGLGISTVARGNVITMGDSVAEKLNQLKSKQPPGMSLDIIYYQSRVVTASVNAFLTNLAEAVAIVIGLLMLFMGWQSGFLIGITLILTILATLIGMFVMGIDLQKISLGALILALGMLVDNAIVVADGILVRVQGGSRRRAAAIDVVHDNAWPLLGATLVAILAFTAIGFSPGNVGEFCRSLFDVMALSLSISWIVAVTVTPLLCIWFLKVPGEFDHKKPHDGPIFRIYRTLLRTTIRFRFVTVFITLIILAGAMMGFSRIPQAFFSPSTQKYFFINYWKPQGTHIQHTSQDMKKIEATVSRMPGVKNITSFVGEGAMRFILSYDYQVPNSSYGQLVVEVDDCLLIDDLIQKTETYLNANFPDAEPHCLKVISGPPITYLVEAQFRGPDIAVLQHMAAQAMEIMHDTPNTRDIRTDWRQQVRVIRPEFSESQARRIGVSRSDLSQALQWNFGGVITGVYREKDELIPIITRPPRQERNSVDNLKNVQVWSSLGQSFVPIGQAITDVRQEWEWPLIKRQDQQRAVTVKCNPVQGNAEPLRSAMKERMAAIELPAGYTMTWKGEFKESNDGREPLKKIFPLCILGMFITVVGLFNSIRRPLIIFLTVPLSIIGIVAGLILVGLPFGFMAILGFLGLSGMLIKNAIVLVEQIEICLRSGMAPFAAILDAAMSRMRPVFMASGTTILGMAPLVYDPMFSAMAVTIMGGLLISTILTLIIVPVFYSIAYNIKWKPDRNA
ncbi:Multidrug efflux pump subunit AcrB [Desulfocicer vacuolatum DSM 3385]|uniref:Multidrug efflux pump subunit AcrB n=1 Tax=Desulfocicer vacuolatum DSM 3385 TaxID=1121400 RepID=A0A1W2BYT3_9BACT|nr:efflux RND transporter permease subunit [Desulfocicer vacuolatum]SMC78089.1 Multidrug efflux pump subunit AcrB [Desulfocicer vacuolatum DSM 3385]